MLAILTTHPIQYQVPLWRELVRRGVPLEVWYLSDHGHRMALDREFGQEFSWDIEMLGGYSHRLLETHPTNPDIGTFRGARIGSLLSLFRSRRITALMINGWIPQAYWQAAFQAHREKIPVLLRGETNDLRKVMLLKNIAKRCLLKSLFRRISVFLTVGVANRRFYSMYGIPENKMVPAPYCVDNNRFSEAAKALRPDRGELRARWGIPNESTCFLFCGKLIEKKRVQDLIQAFEMLVTKDNEYRLRVPIHLLIVGDGALREMIQAKADCLRDRVGRTCVTLTGFLNQSEMPKAYAAADCLVLPSDAGETWGLVVNEAMASGLPAIVSDQVGCAADLIEPTITGDIFPMSDCEKLATIMVKWVDTSRCHSVQVSVEKKIAGYSIARAADGILTGLERARFFENNPASTGVIP